MQQLFAPNCIFNILMIPLRGNNTRSLPSLFFLLFEIHHPAHNGKCIVTQLSMMPDNEPGCTTMQASSSSPPVMMTSTTQLMQPSAMSFKSIQVASCPSSIYEDSCNECSHSGWMFYVFLESEQGGGHRGGD